MEKITSERYINDLCQLFKKTFNQEALKVEDIKSDGSNRKILKLISNDKTIVGVYGPDRLENNAFVAFSKHFEKKKFPVAHIYAYEEINKIYLETYLGDKTLFDQLYSLRKDETFPVEMIEYYKKSLKWLSEFQVKGAEGFDFSLCYPRHAFDRQSIMWDLNYFKYYFAKLASIAFNEQKLEDDFNLFADFLLKTKMNYFLYRDFQSRNIMVKDGETFFIDYQGGRRGALQYDVASLLFDAKADIPPDIREELLNYYLSLPNIKSVQSRDDFMLFYYPYVAIRLMQAMGAYGLRGFYEKKTHFLQSVPYVVKKLEWLIENTNFLKNYPEILKVFKRIISSSQLRQLTKKKLGLNLKIYSFSYKNGIPQDYSGHNGGFVFDCRCLPNPGREERYRNLTGRDGEVIEFLEKNTEVDNFFKNASSLVDQAVNNYLDRNFTDLSVSFGCTGGRHRSVYMAEKLARNFKLKKGVSVILKHMEIGKK